MSSQKKGAYTVAVTGGAPYLSEYDFNTSAMIRDALPNTFTTSLGTEIRILKYPTSMECTFESMGRMIDEIWSKKVLVFRPEARQLQLQEETVDFDLVVHIGMQPSDDRICFESRAFRDHLNFRDLDGKELPAKYVGPGGLWEGLPDVLEPDLNIRMAAEEVAERFPDIESRLSTDAGGYFCEFQFWASLAVLHKQGKRRTACFVHVPKKKDGEAIGNGVKATVAFIGALIESMES